MKSAVITASVSLQPLADGLLDDRKLCCLAIEDSLIGSKGIAWAQFVGSPLSAFPLSTVQ